MKNLLIAALLFGASTIAAAAQDDVFVPARQLDAVALHLGSDAIDVRGLTPGMPMSAAAAILHADFPHGAAANGVQEVAGHFGARRDGVSVISADFVNRINAFKNSNGQSEFIAAAFSGPASGNQLIGLLRGINFVDDGRQPRVADLIADLKVKYGTPTVYSAKPGYFLTWQYVHGSKMTSALYGIVEAPPHEYSTASMNEMLHPKVDDDMTIVVQITPNSKDPTLVGSMNVTAGSHHLRNIAAKADAKAMLDELGRRAALPRAANRPAL